MYMDDFKVPIDATESSTAFFWRDSSGIIFIFNKPRAFHNATHATENIDIAQKILNGIPCPLLVDMRYVKEISRAAREEYAKAGRPGKVTAVALITGNAITRLMANFFISFNNPLVPTRLFNTRDAATKWLNEYLPAKVLD